MFCDLFGKIWNTEESAENWEHGHLVKLPKKGISQEYKNRRGIS